MSGVPVGSPRLHLSTLNMLNGHPKNKMANWEEYNRSQDSKQICIIFVSIHLCQLNKISLCFSSLSQLILIVSFDSSLKVAVLIPIYQKSQRKKKTKIPYFQCSLYPKILLSQ